MLYRRFGRTELRMPVLSTGGMRYQQSWQDVPLDTIEAASQENLRATIAHSIESGINHIETARGYGSSERQLGLILPKYPREELIVQTKIGPEEDAEVFRSNFMESLERLQLDRVDLLAIHGINDEGTLQMSVRPGGCLAVARELQAKGLARHLGFSTHGPCDIITRAIETTDHGGFDYVNIHWYFIYRANWPAILAARQRDMGVFIISPSDKGGLLYKPTPELMELTAPLHPLVFNDLFCLDHDEIHTLSLGAARPSDYDLHLEAVRLYDQRAELLPPIIERVMRHLESRTGRNMITGFGQGVPRWEQFPAGINAPIILWLLDLQRAFGMTEYAQMRYNLLGNAGHWFPGENASKVDEIEWPTGVASEFKSQLREAHERLYKEPVKRLSES